MIDCKLRQERTGAEAVRWLEVDSYMYVSSTPTTFDCGYRA
jgi:hypothetical protein